MTLSVRGGFAARHIASPEKGIAEELRAGREKPRRKVGYDMVL